MKPSILFLLALSTAASFAFKLLKSKAYEVDLKQSNAVWVGKKVTGEHTGNVGISAGSLTTTENKLTGGSFTINLNSITVTDIADAEKNAKLVGHLKGEDFFSTDKYPTSKFEITKVTSKGGDNYELTGNLTIKNITQPVTFPATVKITDKQLTGKANITINRTKYDIKYKSANFFENLGDKAIYDDFTLDVNLVANTASKS